MAEPDVIIEQINLEPEPSEIPVSVVVVATEQCSLCSAHFKKPLQNFAQPYVNSLICKILKVQPPTLANGSSYLNEFIPICPDCSVRVKAYDNKRIELDVLGQEIVSSVLGTLLQIRPYDKTPLDPVKNIVLDKWGKGDDESSWMHGKQLSCVDDLTPPPRPRPRPSREQQSPRTTQIKKFSSQAQQLTVKSNGRPDCDEKVRAPPKVLEDNALIDYNSANENDLSGAETEDDDDYNSTTEMSFGLLDPTSPKDLDSEYVADSSSDDEDTVTKRRKLSKAKGSNQGCSKIAVILPKEKKEPFFCEICGEVFSEMSNLNEHTCKRDEGKNNVKECPVCPMDFPSESSWLDLKSHIDEMHGKIFLEICGFCRKEFLPNTILGHNCPLAKVETGGRFKSARGTDKFPCQHCGKVYRHLRTLREHIQVVHVQGKKPVLVLRGRNKKSDLEQVGEIGEKRLKCEICNRGYDTVVQLNHHKTSYHKPSDSLGMFHCDICGIGLRYKKSLMRHLAEHLGKKDFACEICGKEMSKAYNLRRHMVSHSDVRDYGCDLCQFKFKTSCLLKRHMRTVHKDKKSVNTYAGTDALGVLACESVQDGEPCPLCSSTILFSTFKSLKMHMMKTHSGTNEQIEICSRRIEEDEDDPEFIPNKSEIILGGGIQNNSSTQKMVTRQRGKRVVGTTKEVLGKSESLIVID